MLKTIMLDKERTFATKAKVEEIKKQKEHMKRVKEARVDKRKNSTLLFF